jgi:cytosine/adenosine deaminase-related metal-dependent hydrolase
MPYPEATTLYRARHVLPMVEVGGVACSPIEDGGIAVRGSEILAVERWADLLKEHPGAVREDLGEVILMPGLINAHCHLDYGMMRGALFGGESFSAWIQRLNAMRRSLDQSDYLDSIAEGLDELRHWGCTTVFNIESFPELVPFLPDASIRVWWFLEVLDIRSRLHSAEALAGAIQFFERAGEGIGGFGISPHAPYTASRDLYNLASLYAEKYRMPFCTHLAESEEELAMFTKGEGALYEFLSSIGRPMQDCTGLSPVQMVLGAGLLPKGSLLVHMNLLGAGDRELLKSTAGDFPVIHCPRTHAFFKRAPFDLKFFRESGIPVLIGTDSLASNQDLNMFSEMRAMQAAFPELDPMEILSMATTRPAAAIGMSGRLGELTSGSVADFIAIPDEGGAGALAERVLANWMPPRVWISGRS